MNWRPPPSNWIVLLVSLLAVVTGVAEAWAEGKLDAFEADVKAPAEHRGKDDEGSTDRRRRGRDRGGCASEAHDDVFVSCLGLILVNGGACSGERVDMLERPDGDVTPRALGEPLIPFARTDVSFQDARSDVHAMDTRVEAGYGPVGVHFDFTRYWERDPADRLDVYRTLGLYRMSFGSHVESDIGLGGLTLDGEHRNSRFLLALPLLVHPGRHWGVEFRPAWAYRVSDYDVAALLTWRYASLKAGYRWVRSPHESLDGPYVGVSLRL